MTKIKNWLLLIAVLIITEVNGRPTKMILTDTIRITEVSQELLMAAKLEEATDSLIEILKNLPVTSFRQLSTDSEKKAFWINIYNAFTQILLSKDAKKYQKRNSFFGNKQITIAQTKLSLDDIEHGILRHSKIKWSLGYFNKIFPGKFERENRVKKVDYRIHFSLNCGAKSCPPVAFYTAKGLETELDQATKSYLKGESDYNKETNVIYLPAIMGWFRRDFGGKKKMITLLRTIGIIPKNNKPTIHFKKYDWNLFLKNYQTT